MNTYINPQELINDLTTSLNNKFFFIRHGETEWNKQGLLMGQKDIALNENGILQAELARDILTNYSYNQVFSSPLSRAYETARIITTQPIQILNGLKERSFPSGMLHDDLEHITTDNLPAPFEKWADFSTRISTTLDYILTQNNERPPLIVAHGGVLVAICQNLNIQLPTIKNCQPLFFQQGTNGNWQVDEL